MNFFASFIPLLVFLLLWGIFYESQSEWRISFLAAAVTWTILLVATTELLSLFKAISFWPLLGAWGLYLLVASLVWARVVGNPKNLIKGITIRLSEISRFEIFLLSGIAFIAGIIGLIAWKAPPNTWDSMTYHMARIMHWIQDGSVAYYPTSIIRQLYMNPGSEFIILHFQILSNGDRLANFVQWFSMVGSAIGVSLIARELGANRRGQIFSAVVSMTIPMGILQGSSTQNDYVVSFWLVCFAYWAFVLKREGGVWNSLATGACLGLAVLTKSTTYVYAFPFLVWMSFSILKTYRGEGVKLLAFVALFVLLINLGAYLRNYDLFGNPLGVRQEISPGIYTISDQYSNDIFSIPELSSNVVRNIAVHFGTPFDNANRILNTAVNQFHKIIGISSSDPRTTWSGMTFSIQRMSLYEGNAGDPLDILLMMIALVLVPFQPEFRRKTASYLLSLLVAFLLYSLVLRWHPWESRWQLPLFILWSPMIGTLISEFRKETTRVAIISLLLFGALPWVFFNQTRPFFGPQNIFRIDRDQQYFSSQPSIEMSYPRTVYQLTNYRCDHIGLYLSENDWEYPFWALLRQEIGNNVLIEDVNVNNVSAVKYGSFPEFVPCAILVVSNKSVSNLQVEHVQYNEAWSSKDVSILLPK